MLFCNNILKANIMKTEIYFIQFFQLYQYSLIVDGKEVDTKRMILTQ